MAEDSVLIDQKATRTEAEKERQNEAYSALTQEYYIPGNVSEMKSFAWGRFTWRDVLLSLFCVLIPILLFMPLQGVMPQWLCMILGFVCGLPFVFIVNKHIFTGDLPIEDRLKIAIADRSESNLLYWDKTRQPNGYISSSTQSFVPRIEFTEDNAVLLPSGEGGFMVIAIEVDDMTLAKPTEMRAVVTNFNSMLNALVNDQSCIPIQILLKSTPKNIGGFVEAAEDDQARILSENKYIMATRAQDYADQLRIMNQEIDYYHKYYVVITYRKDAEGVGDDSMKSASVTRQKILEKSNPLNKKAKAAASVDFEIGQDRKKAIKEMSAGGEFNRKKTLAELDKRAQTVLIQLRDMGSTNTDVKPRILTRPEIAKLFYECYNESDKNTTDAVILQALEDKDTLFSGDIYRDFPELFTSGRVAQRNNLTRQLQQRGILGSMQRG